MYVRGVCHDNIAFYMFLPAKIDRAPVSTWWSKSHNNGARCDLWRAREIGYARQMKRPRRIMKIRCEKLTLSSEAMSVQVFLLNWEGQCPSFLTLNPNCVERCRIIPKIGTDVLLDTWLIDFPRARNWRHTNNCILRLLSPYVVTYPTVMFRLYYLNNKFISKTHNVNYFYCNNRTNHIYIFI